VYVIDPDSRPRRSLFDGPQRPSEIRAGANAELRKNPVEMRADRSVGQVEPLANLTVG
jgi:hypothetical protein